MKFTFEGYKFLLKLLLEYGYQFSDYQNWKQIKKPVILRHDVDNDLLAALKFAELEEQCGVKSTYFILLSGDFYNVLSRENTELVRQIQKCGHEIGLHFDETKYLENEGDLDFIRNKIIEEAEILKYVVEKNIQVVSMHRPSKRILNEDLRIPKLINSYGKVFFREFKYLSDSRRCWREPVENIVCNGEFERLHILTHPFWYCEKECDMRDTLISFIKKAMLERYTHMDNNFTDLNTVVAWDEIH